MDSFIDHVSGFFTRALNSTSTFTSETWIIGALVTVLVGYFLLRGNPVR